MSFFPSYPCELYKDHRVRQHVTRSARPSAGQQHVAFQPVNGSRSPGSRSLSPPAPRSALRDAFDNVPLQCYGTGGEGSRSGTSAAAEAPLEDDSRGMSPCFLSAPLRQNVASPSLSPSLSLPLLSMPLARGSGLMESRSCADLQPIAECPSEAAESSPDRSNAARPISPVVTTAKACEVALRDESSSCVSTAPPGSSVSTAPTSATDASRVVASTVPPGSPVSFYIEGCPDRYFARVRSVAPNGKYAVDLVGGGRIAWLDEVTPCEEDIIIQGKRSNMGFRSCADAYAEYVTPNRPAKRSCSPVSGRELPEGCPVSFSSEGNLQFGRIRRREKDGTHVIDLVGGGRKVGVKDVTQCSEEELAKALKLKRGTITSKDGYSDFATRNRDLSPGNWRGTSPSPLLPGRSRRSPRHCDSHTTNRSASPPGPARTRRASGMMSPARSESVPRAWGIAVSGGSCPSSGRSPSPSGPSLRIGQPVCLKEEGHLRPLYGRLRSVAADGTFNVDLVGGMRRTGVQGVTRCGEEDLDRENKSKCGMTTRMDEYAEYVTRNSSRDDDDLLKHQSQGVPRDRSCSPRPASPTLRGVVITRVSPLK